MLQTVEYVADIFCVTNAKPCTPRSETRGSESEALGIGQTYCQSPTGRNMNIIHT